MTKQTITENKRKRLERNERIKERYHEEMKNGMSSAIISAIAKSYRMTIPTVYSILDLPKKDK